MTIGTSAFNLVEQLRSGDNNVFELLYRNYYKSAAAFVKTNSGQEQDARDIFQEALLVLYKQCLKADFQLTTDPGVYLLAVTRKLWLYRLRSRRATGIEIALKTLPEKGSDEIENQYYERLADERDTTIRQLIEAMKPECQELILNAYYRRLPLSEIARLLGYTEAFVKVKKHRCMENLREKARSHPIFSNA